MFLLLGRDVFSASLTGNELNKADSKTRDPEKGTNIQFWNKNSLGIKQHLATTRNALATPSQSPGKPQQHLSTSSAPARSTHIFFRNRRNVVVNILCSLAVTDYLAPPRGCPLRAVRVLLEGPSVQQGIAAVRCSARKPNLQQLRPKVKPTSQSVKWSDLGIETLIIISSENGRAGFHKKQLLWGSWRVNVKQFRSDRFEHACLYRVLPVYILSVILSIMLWQNEFIFCILFIQKMLTCYSPWQCL